MPSVLSALNDVGFGASGGGGGGGTIAAVYRADWSQGGTGTSLTAVTDNFRFNQWFNGINDPEVLSVVPAAPLGFTRTENCLRVMMRGNDNGRAIERTQAVPQATTHWGRMYYRHDETQQQIAAHNFSYNFAAPIQIVFFNPNARASGTAWGLSVYLGNTYPANIWTAHVNASTEMLFTLGAWYRYEWMVEWTSATRFRFYPRLYNPSGVLVADADDFWHRDPFPSDPAAGYNTLTEYYALGNEFGAPFDPVLMRNVGLGNEGRTPAPNSLESWYIADFALSTVGWIGDAVAVDP